MDVIKTVNLTRSFAMGTQSVEALKGIDLNVEGGEFIAIMGPSGSGKTTLMNIIGCLDTPTSGEYYLNNQEVSTMKDDDLARIRNKEIGFVFQSFHLLARSSALNNVMLPLKYAGTKMSTATEMSKNALKDVGLEDRMDHSPAELSGGQQQRVAVARALASKPKFILADEPTANLDSKSTAKLLDIMSKLNKQENITFVFSTHDQRVIDRARRVVTLEDGKIIKDIKK